MSSDLPSMAAADDPGFGPGIDTGPALAGEVPHWRDLPLDAGGRGLIEASAGTGKTWTISVLYLRLLLEQGLAPAQVLVTTFTDAAAQELAERIRARIGWAIGLAGGDATRDAGAGDDAAWLRARWDEPGLRERDAHRLKLAMAGLDLAPIGTLHSICRRVLSDYPFLSGSPFALGELISADRLLASLARDAWRAWQHEPLAAETNLDAATPTALQATLRGYLAPGAELWSPDDALVATLLPPDFAVALRTFIEVPDRFARKDSKLLKALQALAAFIDDPSLPPAPLTLKNLADRDVSKQFKAAHLEALRDDPVLVRAAQLVALLEYRAAAGRTQAWRHWLGRIRAWREERLAASGQLTFDDLVTRVHAALQAPDRALADALHVAWPVALVDEFQDTDGLQYDILDRIQRGADGRVRGRLVMIGDPKQAIYRFRGGDIRAYQAAARAADSGLRLRVNHRSSRAYVAACNAWYAHSGRALGVAPGQPIQYTDVAAADEGAQAWTIDGVPCERPLQFHYLHSPPANAAARRQAALRACANHIVALLSGRDGLLEAGHARPLAPGDIAVLLPWNRDVAALRHLLQARGVPCVGAGRSSVFDSAWARELQLVLHAVQHPRDAGAVRAALATALLGVDYVGLRALDDDEEAWQRVGDRFLALQALWVRSGVLAVVQAVVAEATPRLFDQADHERALTDLRHLGELLQAQAGHVSGPGELLAWLGAQRDGEGDEASEAADGMQLRIESDARRVRLMTLHASKGLEFPVVMLPLMGEQKHAKDAVMVLHEPLAGRRVVAVGDQAKQRHQAEGQDERFRVLYVALTRARVACHVYALPWDRPDRAGPNPAPAKDPKRSALDATLERLSIHLGDPARIAEVSAHVGWSVGWPWTDAPLASTPGASSGQARTALAAPAPAPFELKYSFSALAQAVPRMPVEDAAADDEDLPTDAHAPAGRPTLQPADGVTDADRDALESAWLAGDAEGLFAPAPKIASQELLALAPVRGAAFGNAMHAVFELRDPSLPVARQLPLVERALAEAAVRADGVPEAQLARRLAQCIDRALRAAIPLPGGPVTLAALPPRDVRHEMEFNFRLDAVSMAALRQACADAGDPGLVPATSVAVLRGLMTGKIDLLFQHAGRVHVLDYKSNWLGEHVDDYAPDALGVAMDAHHYRFQALLYTVALERYLRQRIPGYARSRHLGEAVYLFVRAAGLAPGAGLWIHRFPDGLLDRVDHLFAGTAA